MSPSSHPSLALHAALAKAIDFGEENAVRSSAEALASAAGPPTVSATLQLLSLVLGFPKVVQARQWLGPIAACEKTTPLPAPATTEIGETFFRQLYGVRAQRVLSGLRSLDPPLADRILRYAYGEVIHHDVLPLAVRIRLLCLALAATACWRQWRGHVLNARDLEVPWAVLEADLEAGWWLSPAARRHATERLRSWAAEDSV